ncbi:TPA: UMP kinase [Candidatus Komeilibacteria bacterium]|nr:MAG: Uridylate kinase [Parcubacteria group bacterium GW2011_GWF2_45_11]HAH04200.1 UMP kinase [Candidatus Komeilibacteria bacterium]HBR13100.1 UMP kinase [Candidatus Komeilibacteria bacterium]
MKYNRILVKFSGESFGEKGQAIDRAKVQKIIEEIKSLKKAGIKVAVICGGGNIFRGREAKGGDRVLADQRGMRATLKNVDFLFKAMIKSKLPCRVYTSFSLTSIYAKFDYLKVKRDWRAGTVLIFAGGTGHPFFSSDTSGVLRSLELGVDVFVKATKVDGVFSADPLKNPRAKKFPRLSYQNFIEKNLKVIDSTAVCLARDHQLPIRVVKWEPGNIVDVVKGKNLGSLIA